MTPKLSISQARRIALGAQGFDRPRPTKVDRRHLRRVMDTLGVLQLDTIPIIARPQHLVPYSRLGPYDLKLFARVAYTDDEWFESWAHEAALIPMDLEPLFRWRQEDMSDAGHWSALDDAPGYVEQVLADLADRGPLCAGELQDPGQKERSDHAWGGRSAGRLALGRLFAIGKAGSRRIGNFERQFDVIERIVPPETLAASTPTRQDAQRELLRRSAQSLGVGTADDIADYYRIRNPQARPRIAELVESGDLIEVEVEGWQKPAYRAAGSKLPRTLKASALLSPFDPVVWYRDRAERLFDFRYRIEIYVPEAKREFGYYVLPYLLGEELVGRVDVKAERKHRVLRVKGAWHQDSGLLSASVGEIASNLSTELRALAEFQQLDDVVVEANGNLASFLTS